MGTTLTNITLTTQTITYVIVRLQELSTFRNRWTNGDESGVLTLAAPSS